MCSKLPVTLKLNNSQIIAVICTLWYYLWHRLSDMNIKQWQVDNGGGGGEKVLGGVQNNLFFKK